MYHIRIAQFQAEDCLGAFGGTTPELVVVASKAWQLEDPDVVKKHLSGLLSDGAPVLSVGLPLLGRLNVVVLDSKRHWSC